MNTSKKNIIYGVVGLIILFTILTAFQMRSAVKETLAISPTQPPETAVVKDGWLTYTDNENGFSIQYPEDKYQIKKVELPGHGKFPAGIYVTVEPTDGFNKVNPDLTTYSIFIAMAPNVYNLTMEQPREFFGKGPLLEYTPDLLEGKKEVNTSLGGQMAFMVEGCCGSQSEVEKDIHTIHNGNVYELTIQPHQVAPDKEVNKEIYQEILSTFKFLD